MQLRVAGLGGLSNERSGMLRPTCFEIVPRDRTEFETYT